MNNKVNPENYERIFFKLVENEFSTEEASQILEEIKNDPFYAFEWECWQKTKITDQSDELAKEHAAFFANIKDEIDVIASVPELSRPVIPMYQIISTLAACLIVGFGLYFNYYQHDNLNHERLSSLPINEKVDLNVDSFEEHNFKKPILPIKENRNITQKEAPVIATNVVQFKENQDTVKSLDNNWPDLSPISIAKKSSAPFNYQANHDVNAITIDSRSQYRRKFTVSKSDTISAEKIIALSELEAAHTSFLKLLDNKRITMVRVDGKLYVRLIEENQKTILVSLK